MPCTATLTASEGPWRGEIKSLCGKPIVLAVGGLDVSHESLCQADWALRHGLLAVRQPVVTES